jgi:hypothetical protein
LGSFASETGHWSLDDVSEIHVNNGGDALVYSLSLPFAIRVNGENLDDQKIRVKELVNYLQNAGGMETVSVIDVNYHDGAMVSYKKQDAVKESGKQQVQPVGL